MAFAVSLGGMKELEGKLKNLTTALKVDVGDEINSSVNTIRNNAIRLAPVNLGQLRGSIATDKESELTYSVAANDSFKHIKKRYATTTIFSSSLRNGET